MTWTGAHGGSKSAVEMLNTVGAKDATLRNASFKLTLYGCVVSIGCVGFASLDAICNAFHDSTRNPSLHSSFLISVCIFIVSKSLFT